MSNSIRSRFMASLLVVAAAVALAACGGGTGADAPIDESELGAGPLTGTVGGMVFTLDGPGTLSIVEASRVMSFRNYPWACSGNTAQPPASALVINLGALTQEVGLAEVRFGDGHGATFQKGVGRESADAETAPVRRGLIRLDKWSTEAGETVEGAMLLRSDDDEVNGTFTATVCP